MFRDEDKKRIQISIFDGGLVAYFRESSPVAAVHLDLTKSAGLSLVLREEGAIWNLGTVEAGRTFTPIASFNHRDDAEDAFDAVRKAMVKARCRPFYTKPWLQNVLIVLVLLVLAFGGLQAVSFLGGQSGMTTSALTMPEPDIKFGQPMNADDLLAKP